VFVIHYINRELFFILNHTLQILQCMIYNV